MLKVSNVSEKEYHDLAISFDQNHFMNSFNWNRGRESYEMKYEFLGFYENNILCAACNLRYIYNIEQNGYYGYIPRGIIMDYHNKLVVADVVYALKDYARKKNFFLINMDTNIIKQQIKFENYPSIDKNMDVLRNLECAGFKHQGFNPIMTTHLHRFTFRINLHDRNLEDIKADYGKKNIKTIKSQVRRGVEVVDGTINDIENFANLIEHNAKLKGFNYESKEFFEDLYKSFGSDAYLKIAQINIEKYRKNILKEEFIIEKNYQKAFLKANENNTPKNIKKLKNAELLKIQYQKDYQQFLDIANEHPNGVVVAMVLFLADNDKLWGYAGARSYEYTNIIGSNVIADNVIEEFYHKGFRYYDMFGAIDKRMVDHPQMGATKYKESFGGDYIEFLGEFSLYINKPKYIYNKIKVKIRTKIKEFKTRKK